jgi:hypothetical protein
MDGYYDFNPKYSDGGFDNRKVIIRHFIPIMVKISYCVRISFVPNILGMKAVDLVRPHPNVTHEISYHQYIDAN